jgi:hypothetical protein
MKLIIKLLVTTVLSVVLLLPSAKASLLTIDITDPNNSANNGLWDIDIVVGSSMDIEAILAEQVWWQDSDLAEMFMAATWDSLGYSPQLSDLLMAPYFALDAWLIPPPMSTTPSIPLASAWSLRQGEDEITVRSLPGWVDYTFAVATKHTEVPEPKTLILLFTSLLAISLRKRRI